MTLPQLLNNKLVKTVMPVGIVLVGIAIAVLLMANKPVALKGPPAQQSALLVEVIPLERGDWPVIVEGMGQIMPAREVQLKAQVGGKIEKISNEFEPGGFVNTGEVLVTLEESDYKLALQSAEADLALEMGRQQTAREELDILKKTMNTAPNDTYLALRGPQLAQAKAEVEDARLDFERTKVKAPFNALITKRHVSAGALVSPQDTLATLAGTDEYWITLSVPVERLSWLSFGENGSSAHVQMPGARGERTGKLARMVGKLEETSRLAPLIVKIPDPLLLQAEKDDGTPLILGDYVKVTLQGDLLKNVFRLPLAYLRDGNLIWIVRGDTLNIVPVKLLHRDRAYAYFTAENLNETEPVVTTTLTTPVDGMKVEAHHE